MRAVRRRFAIFVGVACALLIGVGHTRASGPVAGQVILGTSTLNFGTTPGGVDATVVVTGLSSVTATSHIEARVSLNTATTDHSADEHRVETLKITTGALVPGTGFTIYGEVLSGRAYGQFTVEWELY